MPTTWIPSGEAFGTPSETLVLGVVGIPSAEAFGTASVTNSSITTLYPVGIVSQEAFGTPNKDVTILVTGLGSGEAFGTPIVISVTTILLCSGVAFGSGTLSLGEISLSGTLTGSGTTSIVSATVLVLLESGTFTGSGTLLWAGPLPCYGYGTLEAFVQLITVPRPFCPPARLPVFRYGVTLGRGDLEIQICDQAGIPFGPVTITFSLYSIVRGGQRMLAGPMGRRPVPDHREGKVGRYYVTGSAGEFGQPGNWVCEWTFCRSWRSGPETIDQPFVVQDAVLAGTSGSGTCRKYGWL